MNEQKRMNKLAGIIEEGKREEVEYGKNLRNGKVSKYRYGIHKGVLEDYIFPIQKILSNMSYNSGLQGELSKRDKERLKEISFFFESLGVPLALVKVEDDPDDKPRKKRPR